MSYHRLLNVFAPRQIHINDVPRVRFDICEPHTQLIETNEARLVRARKIAPVLLGQREIPVPPLPNPLTGISHHRILLHNPLDRSRVVELIFRDTDLYFVGFRRGEVTFLDDDTPQYHWGVCFVFDDLHRETPAFFQATKMGINSAHTGKGDCPGPGGMLHLFYTFYTFEDLVVIDVDDDGISVATEVREELRNNLKIAVGRAIIVFCEALRLSSICKEVINGFQVDTFSTPLSKKLWDLVHCWGTISEQVLAMWRKKMLDLNKPLPAGGDYQYHGFTILDNLIGQDGELVLCKMEVDKLIKNKHVLKLQHEHARINVVDPTFEAQVAGGGRGRGQGRGREGRGRGQGRGREGRGRGGRGRG